MFNMFFRKIPHEYQIDKMDCGPACVKMICEFYGVYHDIGFLRNLCKIAREGVTIYHLNSAFEKLGFNTNCIRVTWNELRELTLPCIVHWKNSHFVVVYRIQNKWVTVSDPSKGIVKYTIEEFKDGWLGNDNSWVVLEIEPTPEVKKSKNLKQSKIIDYYEYISPYRKHVGLLLFLILFLTILQSLVPFISRTIIDVGLRTHDLDFLSLALIGNILIIASSSIGILFRDLLLVNISSRGSVAIGVAYLKKLMAMPLTFFESKLPGDWLQRVSDNEKIKIFILNHAINILFSLLSFTVFLFILFYYNIKIALTVLAFVAAYLIWVLVFLKIKKKSEWKYAEISSENQGFWVTTINHFIDYKLNNYFNHNIKKWRNNQAKSFKSFLKMHQANGLLTSGASLILQISNQLIIFISVNELINGEMSFGTMIAIQILVGMLYGPLGQVMSFFVELQSVKLSFKRVSELNYIPSEIATNNLLALEMTDDKEISLSNVVFQYSNSSKVILRGISFKIIQSKMIVVVGKSGSGKSTLLKLILGLYTPSFGDIFVGNSNLKAINLFEWRKLFGVVSQDSRIISGTILSNITMNSERQDLNKVIKVVDVVCLKDEMTSFNQGYETVIGEGGRGLSEGQKQKILIARALYNDPTYLILDEATNSMDIDVEDIIMHNIRTVYKSMTIIVVAHRPQLAKKADIVIVLKDGLIIENDFREKLEQDSLSHYTKLIHS